MNFTGTSGNDNLTGTSSADTFNMSQGGQDTVNGAGGDDVFNFGGTFDEEDTVNGGSGNDQLNLNGNYGNGQFFIADATLTSVERIHLAAGHNYTLVSEDAIVASGAKMTVDGSDLGAGDVLNFDGSEEASGTFTLEGGLGNDVLKGGAGNDTFYDRNGGNDTADGEGGNDTFNFGAFLTGADTIEGGGGTNRVNITGDYTGSHALVMKGTTFNDVNSFHLGAGFSYAITTADEMGGQGYTLDASALTSGETLTLNASHNVNSVLTVKGGAGDDSFNFGANFHGGLIDGGAGDDSVFLTGDYSSVQPFVAKGLANVEHLVVGAGHSYNFDLKAGSVLAGQSLTINGLALGTGNFLAVDALPLTTGSLTLAGGAGDDLLAGTSHGDIIKGGGGDDQIQPDGGADTVTGGDGDDLILYFGNFFTPSASIDGGTGSDELTLQGDYASQVVFGASTMKNVEAIVVDGDFSYNFKLADANIASGANFQIDADYTSAADSLVFDDSAETNANVTVDGGAGTEVVLAGGGNHFFHGEGGSDIFDMLGSLKSTDMIDGGDGSDTVILNGNYSATFTFGASTMTNVEALTLSSGNNYALVTNDATVGAGQTLTVNAGSLGTANTLNFRGLAETDGAFVITGGAGADTLIGGSGNDSFTGGGGADTIQGRDGQDTYVYGAASDSTSTQYDTVLGFSAADDKFDVAGTISGLDAKIASGTLSTASFNSDLAAAASASHLAAGHAVLFAPNAGTLSGDLFLVIDQNGTAGYQAGQDLVIELANAGIAGLGTANFV